MRRRAIAIAVLAITAIMPMGVSLQPATAWPAGANIYYFDYNVDASTHMKKLDQTITVPGGRFQGGIDFATGLLIGSIVLPESTITFKGAGVVPLLDITVRIIPTKAVTGLVDFNTLQVTATSVFNIRIVRARLSGTPIGLIGGQCITSKPISVTMTGPASLGGDQDFAGNFTLPPFKDCGKKTDILNTLMAGPDNTFSAHASPRE